MSDDLRTVLDRLMIGLRALYGARLDGVYLYGSCARGDADEESDVDVMVVLDDFERSGDEIDRTSEIISALSLECGRSISRVFMRRASWLAEDTPLLRNARGEAVRV